MAESTPPPNDEGDFWVADVVGRYVEVTRAGAEPHVKGIAIGRFRREEAFIECIKAADDVLELYQETNVRSMSRGAVESLIVDTDRIESLRNWIAEGAPQLITFLDPID